MGAIQFKSPETVEREHKESLLSQLESKRKEQEDLGVTLNGVRYSGSPKNRNALLEVIQFAQQSSIMKFPFWKDSDGKFVEDHPMSDVIQALNDIASRRGELIAKEGYYAAQIEAGTLTSVEDLDWATNV